MLTKKLEKIDSPTVNGIGGLAGDYQIIDEIGSGGMSRVYRGRRVSDDQTVAIKVIRIENMAPDYEARLRREPEVQQGIGHKNIVRLFESFRQGEDFILVMEYVDGRSLARMIHRESGPLGFERARQYVMQVLQGVGHLHRLGIVHRDVKPSNILISWDDTVKLADFGIAKFAWEGDRTATRMGLGTPEYMSPEQVSGSGIDHRCDIYALGVTLFEMLTARRPFAHEGSTPMAYVKVIQDVLNMPLPDPRSYQPSIPAEAVELIHRATAKRPEDRFQNSAEMMEALERIPVMEEAPPTVALGAVAAQDAIAGRDGIAGSDGIAAHNGIAAAPGPRDTDATQVLSPHVEPAMVEEYIEEERKSERSTKRMVLTIGSALLLLAGIIGFAMHQWGDSSSESASVMLSDSEARDIANDAAGRYGNYLFGCSADSLAGLYAENGVTYLGRDGVTRAVIAQDLARSCEQNAMVNGVNVTVDEVTPISDVELETRWRMISERRMKDGSVIRDSAVDLVRIAMIDSGWVIISQDRLWGRTHIFEPATPAASHSMQPVQPMQQYQSQVIVEEPSESTLPDENAFQQEPSSERERVSRIRARSEPSGGSQPSNQPSSEPRPQPHNDPTRGYESSPRRQDQSATPVESTGTAGAQQGPAPTEAVGPSVPSQQSQGPAVEQKEEKVNLPEDDQ